MRRLKTVTVGAEDPQILNAIVVSISVDVIQLNGYAPIRRAHRPSAKLAPVFLEADSNQPLLELATRVGAPNNKNLFQLPCWKQPVLAPPASNEAFSFPEYTAALAPKVWPSGPDSPLPQQ